MPRRQRRDADPQSASDAVRWADRSHWFVLPLTGAVSFGVGLSLVFGLNFPGGAYAPLLLLVLGLGALASALAGLATRNVSRSERATTPPPVVQESWVICPSCSARSSPSAPAATPPPVRDAPPLSWLLPAHSTDSGPVTSGDALWSSWLPSAGKMPVELVGPVPETAYVPHREGTPRLYEEGEPIILGLPASVIAAPAGAGLEFQSGAYAAPTSVIGAGDGRTDPVAELEQLEEIEEFEEEADAIDALTEAPLDAGAGFSITDLTIGDIVLREALNPTPPHLRGGTQPAAPLAPERRTSVGTLYGGVRCVDCRSTIGDAADPHRCFLCRRRLCDDCMSNALRTTEGGFCSYCAALQGFVALSRATRTDRRPSLS